MGKFKKGQLVRVLHTDYPGDIDVGDVLPILRADEDGGGLHLPYEDDTDGEGLYFFAREVETVVAVALESPTITIEPGKHYRLSNGKVTGRVSQGDIGFEALVDGQVKVFDKAGGAVFGGDDIVESWVPKVGERVRLTANNRRYGKAGDVVSVIKVNNRDKDIYGQFEYEILGQLKWYVPWAILEPLPVAAPAQPAVWVLSLIHI